MTPRQSSSLDRAIEGLERDRREPDKVLCHMATIRREVLDLRRPTGEVVERRLRLMRDTLAEDIAVALCNVPTEHLEGLARGDTDVDYPLAIGRVVARDLLVGAHPDA